MAQRRRAWWSGWWLANPPGTLFVLTLILGQLWIISRGEGWSLAAGALGLGRPGWSKVSMQSDAWMLSLFAVGDAGEWRLVDPDRASFDEIGAILERRPQDVVDVRVSLTNAPTGVWSITSREHGATLTLNSLAREQLTREERSAIRALVVPEIVDRSPWPDTAALLSQAPWFEQVGPSEESATHRHRVLWTGVASDLLALVLLGALVRSLAWVPRLPEMWRRRRGARALARGRCPRCRYAIEGMTRCPECGEPIPPRAVPAEST